MGARAVDWARLESVCTARYRGFESLPIREHLVPKTKWNGLDSASGAVEQVGVIGIKPEAHGISVPIVLESFYV
jgi:hypothetical protein